MYIPRKWSAGLVRLIDRVQGRGVWQAFQEMESSQWWEPERLAGLQEEKLQGLLGYASRRSPYYAELLEKGGGNGRAGSPRELLSRLPVLEREQLRAHQHRILATGLGRGQALANSTGGSTGVNVPFWVDRGCWRQRDAAALRLYGFLGLEPGARIASVWGSPMDMRASRRLRERVRRVVDNRRLFSAYQVGEHDLDGILGWLGRERPDILTGYASVLDTLARRAQQVGQVEGPRLILSAAEVLYEDQRARIQEAFGVEVFNQYGCREVGLIAVECGRHSGLHAMDERLMLEQDASGRAGDVGADLLVTDLDNRATPFIRYRLGDVVLAGPPGRCPCGRGLSRLGEVVGRRFDIIRGPGGRAVGGTFWSLLLRTGVAGVESFQVVQHELTRIEIRLTPRGALDQRARGTVTSKVQEALGSEVLVEFTEEDQLQPLPSGKHRFVLSMIKDTE